MNTKACGLTTVAEGVPTAPDVKRLDEALGVPSEGTIILYTRLSEIIQSPKASNRFRTVLHAWRRKLFREHNVELDPTGDAQGLIALPPGDRIGKAVRNHASGRRKQRRAWYLSSMTDRNRLSSTEQQAQDFLYRRHAAERLAEITASKPLRIPIPEIVSKEKAAVG
jgi:hypothetical protein